MKTLSEQILSKKSGESTNEDMGSNDHMGFKVGKHHISVNVGCHVGKSYDPSLPQAEDDIAMQTQVSQAIEDEKKAFLSAVKEKLAAMQSL